MKKLEVEKKRAKRFAHVFDLNKRTDNKASTRIEEEKLHGEEWLHEILEVKDLFEEEMGEEENKFHRMVKQFKRK